MERFLSIIDKVGEVLYKGFLVLLVAVFLGGGLFCVSLFFWFLGDVQDMLMTSVISGLMFWAAYQFFQAYRDCGVPGPASR